MNDREVHKKVSPKFTICFSDLANYLGMNVFDKEKVDRDEETVQKSEPDTMPEKPLFNQTPKQSLYERNQPSVIKEEKEENDEDEQNNA